MRTKRVCMLLPPGPEQSWLIMILRRDCALAEQAQTRSAMASARKYWIFPPKITFLLYPLPPPPFFGSVDSAGLKLDNLGSADSKGFMGIVLVSGDSNLLTKICDARIGSPSEYMMYCNPLVHSCQAKIGAGSGGSLFSFQGGSGWGGRRLH